MSVNKWRNCLSIERSILQNNDDHFVENHVDNNEEYSIHDIDSPGETTEDLLNWVESWDSFDNSEDESEMKINKELCEPPDSLFQSELSVWATQNKVTHTALNSLLKILKRYGHEDLPSDCRTLLKTP